MSPVADIKTLRAAAKSGSFAPVYYLFGDDDYVKEEEQRRLVDAAIDPATRDFNCETLRAADLDAETLGSIVGTPPMMAERRAVIVRDVGALKKAARAVLDRYLESPASDLLLVLVAPAGAKADRGISARATAVEFKPLSGARIPKWIAYYVEHDLHATITPGAITLLQEAAGTELAHLKAELDKLVNFTSGAAIDEAAVAAVVGIRPGETMGDLLDAVARRDARAAVAMLPAVLQQPKSGAVPIVLALTVQMLGIGWAQAARDRGASPARLSGEMFALLKDTGAHPWRAWGEFASTCARASDVWSAQAVDDALRALLDADVALKTTRVSSQEQTLSTLVLTLCGASARRRVA